MPKSGFWSARALAALRIAAGLLFLEAGLVKLAHFPAASPDEPNPLPALLVVAGCLEVVGGSLVTLGLFTRATAFLLSGEMALAYFLVHAPKSFWPAINHGDEAILFCFVFLHLALAGPGAWSLDGLASRRARPAAHVRPAPRVSDQRREA
jgi:putative oxidoreductase